ncbi:hypothetical protein CCAX7_006810 [Capsulimonas corticalis]|uniref:Uncharacterized protein n=1 Tax=Capsulimonas corticalis TaxID=2219043 RepID=A0A402D1F8_9BACT|nr:DUF559 domain-containing protein [Capsulimonas corticalis]BDI28630.1 hypothetical protein CCAX7_006810 [Capsulimonas corticalis]
MGFDGKGYLERLPVTDPVVLAAAQQMRREMTPMEQRLWNAISGKKLNGLRFRSQHPFGRFVIDFYCPSCKLAVEVDGSVHEGREEYDAERTLFLQSYGCRVIRFRNNEILNDLSGVLTKIIEASEEQIITYSPLWSAPLWGPGGILIPVGPGASSES